MHKKAEKVTKSHFAVAITYLLHAFALALVDGFIAVLALRQDFKSNGDEYNSDAWVEIGLYVVYLTVLFAASFFFVPLLQMLLVTWSLARFKKSRNCSTLADYIPEARFLSTVIAQVWCMATFFVTWSSPDGESFCSTFRFVVSSVPEIFSLSFLDRSASSSIIDCVDRAPWLLIRKRSGKRIQSDNFHRYSRLVSAPQQLGSRPHSPSTSAQTRLKMSTPALESRMR